MTVIRFPGGAERAALRRRAAHAAAVVSTPEIATSILMACDDLSRDMVDLAVNQKVRQSEREELLAIVDRAAAALEAIEDAVADR